MENLSVISTQEVLNNQFNIYGSFEQPLFLAKDVAELIDYSKRPDGSYNTTVMLTKIDDDEKIKCHTTVNNVNGGSDSWFLTENGLYEVLMLSRKPIAKEFKKQIKEILHNLRTHKVEIVPHYTDKELETLDRQSRVAAFNCLHSLADEYAGKGFDTYKQILDSYATKELTGKMLLPLPEADETFTATEIAEKLGVTAREIGTIANKNEIKTDSYGIWVLDKAKNCDKEVRTFRYNTNGLNKIKSLLNIAG